MIADGLPKRLERIPASLIYLELVAAVVASAAASRSLLIQGGHGVQEPDAVEFVRRGAVCALFCLHTVRFHIAPGSSSALESNGSTGDRERPDGRSRADRPATRLLPHVAAAPEARSEVGGPAQERYR